MWKFYKSRLAKAFRRRGWQVKYCKNGALFLTTPRDMFFLGPDATPDNFFGFAWSSLIDNRSMYSDKNTLRNLLREFDELNQ